jgi:hypothetical protein
MTEMTDLQALLDRLKRVQRELIDAAAAIATMPSDGTIRKISELEGVIAAVENLIEERRSQRRGDER